MGEPKICVYAICKNEEKFLPRWIESLREADYISVLDTGSSDNSLAVLKGYSPFVYFEQKVYDNFRFDVARNDAMKLIPEDAEICVVSDCDQVFRPGWAKAIKEAWMNGYRDITGPIIDYDEEGNEEKRFLSKNVHEHSDKWVWERPVHEGLVYKYDEGEAPLPYIELEDFVIEHHQDKSKDRNYYLDLLEEEYKENHKDPTCMIYYGCELSFHNKLEEALSVFLRGEKECDFSNEPKIGSQTIINISIACRKLNLYEKSLEYAIKAFDYGIKTRKVIVNLARVMKEIGRFNDAQILYRLAIKEVPEEDDSWIEDHTLFNGQIYKELSEIYSIIGNTKRAIDYLYLYRKEATLSDQEKDRLDNEIKEAIQTVIATEFGGGGSAA